MNRRDIIKTIGLGGLALCLPLPLLAQETEVRFITTPIADNVTLISGAGANVVVAGGSDGVVVIDGGLRRHAEQLLAEVRAIAGDRPIKALFNTNWRPEHVGLNYLLGDEDVPIIAHENTRLWQTAETYVEWEDKLHQPLPDNALANKTFYRQGSLSLDGGEVRYGHLPRAHTDGDLYVHFPEANVLVAGDVAVGEGWPSMDYVTGGWIRGMQEATARLLEIADEDTAIIGAEGKALSKADLQVQADMLEAAYQKVADAFRAGFSLEDFKASKPSADFPGQWGGDPETFLTQLYRGTWYHIPGRAVRNVI